MHIFSIFLSCLFLFSYNGSQAPKKISDFTLTNVVDGNSFSLSSQKNTAAVVVIFTSNNCPYDKLYNQRIERLIDTYSNKNVSFVLINSNDPQRSNVDSPRQMANKIKELRWNVPYLVDNKRLVASKFGAEKNPEAYVLQHRNNTFQILYSGSIDDNPQVASDVSEPYLSQALDAILSGKPVLVNETHPTGCMIK